MAEAEQKAADRQRSPGFPTIPLSEAVDRVRVFWRADRGAPATAEVLAQHWKTSTKSSAFLQGLASIKRFGLLEDAEGRNGMLKPSRLALDILMLPEQDAKHEQAVKQAALLPKMYAELWKQFGTKLPSDPNLRHYLVTEKHVKANVVGDLIRQYKRTLEFAKLGEGDKVGESGAESKPKRPLGEAVDIFQQVFGPHLRPAKQPTPTTAQEKSEMQPEPKQDVFNLNEGPVVLQWPSRLSAESFADLKDWLELQLRKIGRTVTAGKSPEENTAPQN